MKRLKPRIARIFTKPDFFTQIRVNSCNSWLKKGGFLTMKISWHKMAALAAMMVLLGGAASFAAQVSVTVQKADGTVEARASAGAAWKGVSQGDKLSAGASVKTGPGSSCVLTWGGGHVLKLQGLTSLDISKLDRDDNGRENSGLDLSKGMINAHVAKLRTNDSTFQVKTPTAIAGVRGTDLFVNVAEDKTSTFGVTEGEIFVEAAGVETVVMQDFIVTVNPAGEAAAPAPMPEEMKQEAREQANEIKQESKLEKEPEGKGEDKKGTGEQGKGIEKQEEKAATGEKESAEKTETTEETETETEEASSAGEETGEAPAGEVTAESAAVEPVAPEDVTGTTIDAAIITITDTVLDQQITNDIIEAAQEQIYKTGGFEVDIYIEP
ncbi:MAG: FecR family protein [bacterium]